MVRLAEGIVFTTAGEVAAVEEVGEGVFVDDAVHADVAFGDGEVDAVVPGAAAVELFAGTVKHAESAGEVGVLYVTRLDVQGFEKLELHLGRQPREFGSADFIEDDLDHVRRLGGDGVTSRR